MVILPNVYSSGAVQFDSEAGKLEVSIRERRVYYRSATSIQRVRPEPQFDRDIGLVPQVPAPAQV